MFDKSFCKKPAALLTAAALFCGLAGCGNKETANSVPDSVSSVLQSVPDEKSEAAQGMETSSDNNAVIVSQSAGSANPIGNTSSDLSEPFTQGSFTVEPPVYPWNYDDEKTAWRMTYEYKTMTTFSDRVFLDFTGDDIPEMLLVCGYGKVFYIFQKSGDAVSLFAKSEVDGAIYRGGFLPDPPMEEDEFHYDDPDINYSRGKFAVFEDSDKQRYIIIFTWSGTLGLTSEIKKIEIQDGVITFPVVYRWGLFKELGYDAMNIVMRYKKHLGDDNYEEVPRQEIEDYLKGLTIVTQMPLK